MPLGTAFVVELPQPVSGCVTVLPAAAFLSYKGQIVIDVANQQLRVVNAQGDTAKLPSEASTNLVRKYSLQGDALTLSMVDGQGQTTAKTVWKKRAGA